MNRVLFSRVRDVPKPHQGHQADAGYDFYIPVNWNHGQFFILGPQHRLLIPSGVKVKVPKGYALIAFNKSGVSTNYGLDRLAEVIDSGYQGEVHLSIVNTSSKNIIISPGQKLLQFILIKLPNYKFIEVPEKDLFRRHSARANHGFGSTGV